MLRRLPLRECLNKFGEDELNRLSRRVVRDYRICRVGKVAVRTHDGDDGDARIIRLLHRMLLVFGIHDE